MKLNILNIGVLFFLCQFSFAQKKKKDTTITKIDEVVLVAFGKQKKETLVGSISVVDKKILETQQLTSVTSALQGSVPGIQVINSDNPEIDPAIKIRGTASISASTNPLIILDGIPYNGNINSISQDQVESISVLKDASSTSLYGSRGANGVILITTKNGKKNQAPHIELSAQTGFSSLAVKTYELVGAEKYMELYWEALRNSSLVMGETLTNAASSATSNLISNLNYNPYNIDNPVGLDGKVLPGARLLWDTDWKKAIINKAATRNNYGLTLQGGDNNTTYFFSTDYLNQESQTVTSYYKRLTTRLNLGSQIKPWLKVGINTSFSTTSYKSASSSYSLYWVFKVANIYPVYRRNENGDLILDNNGKPIYDYGANGSGQNQNRPVFNKLSDLGSSYNDKENDKRYDITLTGYVETEVFKGLKNKLQAGYQFFFNESYIYTNPLYDFFYGEGAVRTSNGVSKTINVSNILSYQKTIGNHYLNIEGIFESYQLTKSSSFLRSEGFLPGVYYHNGSTKSRGSGDFQEERIVSVLSRLMYNYKDKYFIEGSYREDGSSRFSSDTRWGGFYSMGSSWLASKEDFFKNNCITYLKFRGSYGELGNNRTLGVSSDDFFPYVNGYNTGYPDINQAGIYMEKLRFPGLAWEKTSSLNIGADFELFKRVNITVDYYKKSSIDLLYDRPLPSSIGFSSIVLNTGKIENSGWEFGINSTNIKNKHLIWTTNLNFSLAKNKIKKLDGGNFVTGTKRWEVGRSLFDFWIQEYAGVDPNDGFMMWYKDIVDVNGNTIGKEATKNYSEATRYYSDKTSLPKIQGGFSNYIKYKSFDLNFLFNFSFGSYILDSNYADLLGAQNPGEPISVDIDDRWQKPGDVTDIPILLSTQNNFNQTSTRWLFKNDYIRLKSLTLGYNMPAKLINQLRVHDLRLYIQADNFLTWQSHKGIDPEQSFSGIAYTQYVPKTVSFGFKIGF